MANEEGMINHKHAINPVFFVAKYTSILSKRTLRCLKTYFRQYRGDLVLLQYLRQTTFR